MTPHHPPASTPIYISACGVDKKLATYLKWWKIQQLCIVELVALKILTDANRDCVTCELQKPMLSDTLSHLSDSQGNPVAYHSQTARLYSNNLPCLTSHRLPGTHLCTGYHLRIHFETSQIPVSDTHVSVKFELSCAV